MAARDTVKKFADAVNAHDLDAAVALWAPDAEIHDPGIPEAVKGKDAIRQNLGSWLQAFPDMKFEVLEPVLSADNNVGFQVRISGTHTGDLVGPQGTVPPTNSKLHSPAWDFGALTPRD